MKDQLFDYNRKKNKILHGNYARVSPYTEVTSRSVNQPIARVDHYHNATPIPSVQDVIDAKRWVDENQL